MPYLFQIWIEPNYITVKEPLTGYSWNGPNLIAYAFPPKSIASSLPGKSIVAAFVPGPEAEKIHHTNYLPTTELVIQPAFHSKAIDHEITDKALERLVMNAATKINRWEYFSWRVGLTTIDYDLYITEYEQYPHSLKKHLEYTLQSNLRAGKLMINNTDVAIDSWKRTLELWLGRLTKSGPFLILIITLFLTQMLPVPVVGLTSLAGLGLFFLSTFLAEPNWAMTAKHWLPIDYLLFVFKSQNKHYPLRQTLTHWLLSNESY